MTAKRLLDTLTEVPADMSGNTYATQVQEAVKAIWNLLGGQLTTIGGTANAITANLAVATGFDGINAGFKCSFTPAADNTGAATITIQGYAKAIERIDGSPLSAGDLKAGEKAFLEYDSGFDSMILVKNYGGVEQVSSPAYNSSLLSINNSTPETILTLAFTCRRAASKIHVEGHVQAYDSGGSADDVNGILLYLYVDGSDSGITAIQALLSSDEGPSQHFIFEYTPGDSAAHTYTVRMSDTAQGTTVEVRHAMMKITEYGDPL